MQRRVDMSESHAENSIPPYSLAVHKVHHQGIPRHDRLNTTAGQEPTVGLTAIIAPRLWSSSP